MKQAARAAKEQTKNSVGSPGLFSVTLPQEASKTLPPAELLHAQGQR